MAIHPSYPDIIVRIGAHGAYMRQYLDKGQDEIREVVEKASVPEPVRQNTVSHYVESITDTQFEIILDVRGYWTYGCPSLGFECLVDGQHIETTICLPHQFVDGQWRHILRGQIVPSVENGISFMRRFKFSGISLVDDHRSERVQKDAKRVLDVGSIVVKVHRMGSGRELAMTAANSSGLTTQTVESLSEKALKGKVLSHAVAFGEQERLKLLRSRYDAVALDPYPMALFRFRYRSRETLKSLSIETHQDGATVPVQTPVLATFPPNQPSRSLPSPPPSASLDPLAGLSSDQLVNLAREQLAIAKVSTLPLVELERLAAPHADISILTLKALKEIASKHLVHTEDVAANLTYRELKILATERIRSRDLASAIEMRPVVPSNAASNPVDGSPSALTPSLNNQRHVDSNQVAKSGMKQSLPTISKQNRTGPSPSDNQTNPATKPKFSLRWQTPRLGKPRPVQEPKYQPSFSKQAMHELKNWFPLGIPVQKLYFGVGESCRIQTLGEIQALILNEGLDESVVCGGLEAVLREAERLACFQNVPEEQKAMQTMRARAHGPKPRTETIRPKTSTTESQGSSIESEIPKAKPAPWKGRSELPKTELATASPNPSSSETPAIKSETSEKTSVSSFLQSISGNIQKGGSKRAHEDDATIPEKLERPYKVKKKRNGSIIVDLTGDE